MLKDLLRFEWRYHTRQISFYAALLIYAALGFTLSATGFGPNNVHINSPFSITESLGITSLASVFVLAVFCASAIVRDREHQFEEIVFTTSVEKFDFLFGRFGGSFLAAFTAFCATILGMVAGLFMPWQDPATLGPIAPLPYIWALLVMVLPAMLFAAVLLFAIATLTRSMIASVVGAVAIYCFYFIASAFTNSPVMAGSNAGAGMPSGASLLDPFGLSAFFEQTRYWTPSERDTRLIALTGNFLLNRVLWIAAAAGVWWVVYRRFSFRIFRSAAVPAAGAAAPALSAVEGSRRRPSDGETPSVQRAGRPRSSPSDWRALLAATRLELRSFLTSIPFLLLTLLWCALAISEIVADLGAGEPGATLYPTTGRILDTLQQPLMLVSVVVIVYYSAEIVWREKMIAMAEVVNATPASNIVFVVAKWIALSTMSLVLIVTGLLSGVLVQIMRGYPQFEPGVLLSFLYVAGMPMLLFAAAAVLIQTLSPHKYIGMLLVLIAAIVIHKGDAFGIEHALLRYGSSPPIEYSEMNGYGHYLKPFNWFMALWSLAGALLLMLAAAKWRGKFRTNAFGRRLAATLAVAATAVAAFIFYNTNVLNTYEPSSETVRWRVDYEKKYAPTLALPQPRIVSIGTSVDLYPKERRYQVRGAYQLINDQATPIRKVLVAVRRNSRVANLAVPNAKATHDARFSMWTFDLAQPLAPGERTRLDFDITTAYPGFEAGENDTEIVENGTFIFDRRAFPTLGFRGTYRISNPAQRRKYGLPPVEEVQDFSHGGEGAVPDEWVDLDATISTDADQTALTSGRLIRKWTTGDGRRWFRYRTDRPIHNVFTIASARYQMVSGMSGRTKVEVYFHPAHREQNVARILAAASDSLRRYEQMFGPYPHDALRIVEGPSYLNFGGYATPGLIILSEDRAFLIDSRDTSRVDLVSRRTAHEVAHQWWGHEVAPVTAFGASTIVESLTKYSELVPLEEQQGRAVLRLSLPNELDGYLAGRADDAAEAPLSRVLGQSYLYYRKGAIVMWALRDLLGAPTFHRALQNFSAEQSGPGHKTLFKDLQRHLHAVATPEQRTLIDQWLTEIVLYDLRLTSATTRPINGKYEVTMQLTASKTNHPLDEELEFGLIADDGTVIATKRQRIRDGANTVTVIANKKPAFAAIDPYFTRLDRDPSDNVLECGDRSRRF